MSLFLSEQSRGNSRKNQAIYPYELEITSVNQAFLKNGELMVQNFGCSFAWLYFGTHYSLVEASVFIEVIEKRQDLKIVCIEDITYRHGWISAKKLYELAQPMRKNQYG